MANRLSDPQLADLARRAGAQTGVRPSLLRALIQAESGGNVRAGSPMGAQGLTQLMPGTARGLGVRNVYDPWQNVLGGAKYLAAQMERFDDPRLALSAYNSGPGGAEAQGRVEAFSETQNYVQKVLELEKQYRDIDKGQATALPGVPPSPGAEVQPTMPAEPAGGYGLSGALGLSPGTPPPELDLERLTAGAGLSAIGPLSEQTAGATQAQGEQELVGPSLADFMAQARPQPQAEPPPSMADVMPGDIDQNDQDGNWQEWVKDPEPREGESKHHTPEILRAVGMVGQRLGRKLQPWGNESHSKMTVNGNVSAHYSGNAADIPGQGKQLAKMGYAALVMAGMDPDEAQAAAKKGGLFNVGDYQIIFNTNQGGNHFDHLHLGLRGQR